MGYYTVYRGSVTGPVEFIDLFVEDAEDEKTFGQYEQDLSDWLEDYMFGSEPTKWYDWQKDMVEISGKYPHLLFELDGEGEESGDIWKAWARNGKVVVSEARIVFDPPGDLDEILPSPDIEKALAKLKVEKRAAIQAEIDKLKFELENI